jgi:hypothetical protein
MNHEFSSQPWPSSIGQVFQNISGWNGQRLVGTLLTYNDKLDRSANVINNLYYLNHHWLLQLGAKAHSKMPKTSSGLAAAMELCQMKQMLSSVEKKMKVLNSSVNILM